MRDFLSSAFGAAVKWLMAILLGIGSGYFTVEAWVDRKVQAAETRVMFVRGLDMEHLNKRFDVIERLLRDEK